MQDGKLERELDATLARYGAAEPREGLEQRVLANLRAQQISQGPRRSLLQGRILAAAATVMMAALVIWEAGAGFARKTGGPKPQPKQEMVNSETTNGSILARGDLNPQAAKSLSGPGPRVDTSVMKGARPTRRTGGARDGTTPTLAQFPSPEPLSEQEKLLVRYVEVNRREVELTSEVAALIQRDNTWKPNFEDVAQDEW